MADQTQQLPLAAPSEPEAPEAAGVPARIPKQHVADLAAFDEINRMVGFAKQIAGAKFITSAARGDVPSVFYLIAMAQDMGAKWTHGLRSLYMTPDGRVGIQGDFALALLLSKGFRVGWPVEEKEASVCQICRPECRCKFDKKAKRVDCECGRSHEVEYTLERARESGYYGKKDSPKEPKPNWKDSKNQLKWRSLMFTARFIAADILGGLYLPDELQEIIELETPEPRTLATVERQAGVDQPQVEESKVPAELESNLRAAAHEAGRTQGWAAAILAQAQNDSDPKGYIKEAIANIATVKAPKKRGKPDTMAPVGRQDPGPDYGTVPAAAARDTAKNEPPQDGFPNLLD